MTKFVILPIHPAQTNIATTDSPRVRQTQMRSCSVLPGSRRQFDLLLTPEPSTCDWFASFAADPAQRSGFLSLYFEICQHAEPFPFLISASMKRAAWAPCCLPDQSQEPFPCSLPHAPYHPYASGQGPCIGTIGGSRAFDLSSTRAIRSNKYGRSDRTVHVCN